MFKTLAAAAALVGLATAAQADGMYTKPSYKHTPLAPAFSWTGFYIGGTLGFGVGDTAGKPDFGFDNVVINIVENLIATDYDVDGAIYGIHIGYNRQLGNLVYGIEAALNGTDIDGSTTCVLLLKCERQLDYYATLTGRLGYAVDRTLFYGFGGLAFGEVQTNVSIAGFGLLSGEETHTGWTAGIGIEHAMTDNFIIRIEYAHVDLGEENTRLKFKGGLAHLNHVLAIKDKVEMDFDVIKVGASYKFGARQDVLEPMK